MSCCRYEYDEFGCPTGRRLLRAVRSSYGQLEMAYALGCSEEEREAYGAAYEQAFKAYFAHLETCMPPPDATMPEPGSQAWRGGMGEEPFAFERDG